MPPSTDILFFPLVTIVAASTVYFLTRRFFYVVMISPIVAVYLMNRYYPDAFFLIAAIPLWFIALAISIVTARIIRNQIMKRGGSTSPENSPIHRLHLYLRVKVGW